VGGNEKENLVELTIEDHAEAHRLLFEEHGCWQDKIAWQTLSGQISGIEAAQLARRLANTGDNSPMRRCPGAKEKMIKAKTGQTLGPCSEETKRKISEKALGNTRGSFSKGTSRGKGVPKSEESNQKRRSSFLANTSAMNEAKIRLSKVRINHAGTIWINNGIQNKRHPKEHSIPEGFIKGRKI